MLLDQQTSDQPGPEDDQGPAELRGPKRDELWTTPDTKAATLAPYLDAWRHKVERIGTINFPRAARMLAQKKANPVIEVGIASDGRWSTNIIRRTSGSTELDNAALQTLKLAAPFDPFPPELAREHHVLRFVYEWQWTAGWEPHSHSLSLPLHIPILAPWAAKTSRSQGFRHAAHRRSRKVRRTV